MGFLYFDDSKHPECGFALGVFVFCDEDPSELINSELLQSGLKPGEDEFKSSALMSQNQRLTRLRGRLRTLLVKYCELALAACGRNPVFAGR